uniref:Thiamine pyrophosphate enzyme n=1 Tax=viral metagenome TaxID=1070528 RepID=A0A6C0B8Z6_9ZZZZ
MKIKVSDYIVNFFNKNGIDTLFTITGGFAMHLNDSFGRHSNYKIHYQHHEQACGYSAVGYSKTNSKPCIVCTTAGCAATNAITPCLVAHQDSLPVLFISGQVKSTESIQKINTKNMVLRHYAGADCDIISMVTPVTKYAKEVLNIEEVKDVLIEAFNNLINGRPGPVWLSIPVDIQGLLMEETDIPILKKANIENNFSVNNFENIYELLKKSERPIIIAGNGIKLGNCIEKFKKFLNHYNIPVVVTILATDVIENDNKLFCGKIGLIGDRAGNFAMQNCDLLISLGCRMAQGIVGYREDWFAREAKIVYIDNDQNELEKTNTHYDLKINMDLNNFFDAFYFDAKEYSSWNNKCLHWKNKWQFETPKDLSDANGINPYHFLKQFYYAAPNNKITIASSGSIVTNVWHMVNIKENDKFLHSSQGDMGFELTCAIGAQIAEPEKLVTPILGEGSFQLNIQELQTIVQYKLPLKILLFNNGAYGAIEITQTNFFKAKFGVDYSSGLSFPDSKKIANAYGINYISVRKNEDIENAINTFLSYDEGAIILEIFCCIQGRVPRLNAIKNDDGTFTNRPFEDMDPFLSREEFEKEMIVKIV